MSVLRLGAVCCVVLAGAGCLRADYVPTRFYTLTPEIAAPAAAPGEASVGVRTLDAARPYRDRMMYRDEADALQPYHGVEWAQQPRDAVTTALIDALKASGRFADVGRATDMMGPDFLLLGHIRRFEEDRATSPPEAVVEMALELRDGETRDGVWADSVTARVTMERSGPDALASAMSQAVGQAVEEAAAAIAEY